MEFTPVKLIIILSIFFCCLLPLFGLFLIFIFVKIPQRREWKRKEEKLEQYIRHREIFDKLLECECDLDTDDYITYVTTTDNSFCLEERNNESNFKNEFRNKFGEDFNPNPPDNFFEMNDSDIYDQKDWYSNHLSTKYNCFSEFNNNIGDRVYDLENKLRELDEYDEEYEEESNNKTFLEQILTFGEDLQERIGNARDNIKT
jgi:hypothetical protein